MSVDPSFHLPLSPCLFEQRRVDAIMRHNVFVCTTCEVMPVQVWKPDILGTDITFRYAVPSSGAR